MEGKKLIIKSFIYTLFFIVAFIVNISCENPVDSLNNSILYPISIGNYWKYKIYTYSSGKILPGLTDSLLITIDEEISVEFEDRIYKGGVQTRKFGENTYAEAKWIFTNQSDGLYFLGGIAKKDTIFRKFLYLKYPVKQGETWEVPYMYYNQMSERFEFRPDSTLKYICISTNEKINTEIGEFRCIVYHFKEYPEVDVPTYWNYYLYYSPGIGFIGSEIRSDLDNSIKHKIILVNYGIK